MTAAPSDPLPSTALPEVPSTPATALGRLSAIGAALIEAGRTDEAVDVLRQAVAAGEPGAPDLLARAYLESGELARRRWSGWAALVAPGTCASPAALGRGPGPDRRRGPGREDAAPGPRRRRAGRGQRPRDPAARRGPVPEAVPLLRRAADAGDPQAAANLVELLLEAGDLRAAVAGGRALRRRGRPDTVVALADVRAASGRPDEAERPVPPRGGARRAAGARGLRLVPALRARRRGGGRARVPGGRAARRARLGVHPGPVPASTTAGAAEGRAVRRGRGGARRRRRPSRCWRDRRRRPVPTTDRSALDR